MSEEQKSGRKVEEEEAKEIPEVRVSRNEIEDSINSVVAERLLYSRFNSKHEKRQIYIPEPLIVYIKRDGQRTISLELQLEKYLDYLDGQVTFGEMMKDVSCSDIDSRSENEDSDEDYEWRKIKVVLSDEDSLSRKPTSPKKQRLDLSKLELQCYEDRIADAERKAVRIEEAQRFFERGDAVGTSIGNLLMFMERYSVGEHNNGWYVYERGVDLVTSLPIGTEVVEVGRLRKDGEVPSEGKLTSSRSELVEMLLELNKEFRVVQVSGDVDGWARMAILFDEAQ